MVTTYAIGYAGERAVAEELKRRNFSGNWDTRQPGATDIEAWRGSERHIIQVKTAMYPEVPSPISTVESALIIARATRLGAQAWEAHVQLGAMLLPIGTIRWRKLN